MFEFVAERAKVLFALKVFFGPGPFRDGGHDPADELPDASLPFRSADLPPEVLGDNDVGGLLRPERRYLDVTLLKDHFATFVADDGGSQIPFHFVERVSALTRSSSFGTAFRKESRERQPAVTAHFVDLDFGLARLHGAARRARTEDVSRTFGATRAPRADSHCTAFCRLRSGSSLVSRLILHLRSNDSGSHPPESQSPLFPASERQRGSFRIDRIREMPGACREAGRFLARSPARSGRSICPQPSPLSSV